MLLSKSQLHHLIADVQNKDPLAVQKAVRFIAGESLGMWHNRARAKLCRHFKRNPPGTEQQAMLVDCIAQRLGEGRFYEQFKDQLAMAVSFSPDKMAEAAEIAMKSDRRYIRKYGKWLQHRLAYFHSSQKTRGNNGIDRNSNDAAC